MLTTIARHLARPAVVDWLIRRAARTPYQHLTDKTTGSVYMERYWLFNPFPARSDEDRRWFLRRWLPSVRLHRIMRADQEHHMHDHPWNARTFILRGWYREVRPRAPNCPAGPGEYRVFRNAGTTARLRFGEYHRITTVPADGVWTLFITWRKRGSWGFLVDGKKVNWREYLGIPKGGE